MKHPPGLAALIVLTLASLSCAYPPGTASPPLQTVAPPTLSQAVPAAQTAAPTPEVGSVLGLLSGEDLALQQAAMRSGFESDVAAHASALYQVSLTLTDDPIHISGTEQVRFRNDASTALDDMVFRLYPNALTRQPILSITSTSVNSESVEASVLVQGTALRIPLAEPLPPGEAVEVALDFTLDLPPEEGIGWGRLGDINGVVVLSSFIPLLSVYEAGGWWLDWPDETGDPVYSAVALWDVTLTAPASLKVASTGTVVDTTPSSDAATATYRIVTGPVRDFSLALSADFELLSEVRDGVMIHVWSAPGDQEVDRAALQVAGEALGTFDRQFGLYPFNELDMVQAPILAAGIEAPGLIYIGNGVWDSQGNPFFEWVISHEVAHQWWYGVVGNNQVDAPWLDEGLAEYSVELYFAATDGLGGADIVRAYYENQLEAYVGREGVREPVGRPAASYDAEQYRVFVYSAGALFYNHLADVYGSEAVAAFLRAYYQRFRYDLVYNADLQQLVETTFGQGAGEFFADWVYVGGLSSLPATPITP